MAKRGSTRHQKRLSVPKAIASQKYVGVWMRKPLPGKHRKEKAMPMAVVLKDLGLAANAKEAKAILSGRQVSVDGTVVTEMKQPVGLMDVITVMEKSWRVLFDRKGRIVYTESKTPKSKMCRVEKKTRIRDGKMQLTLNDGRSLTDQKANVGDGVVLSLPEGKAESVVALQPGAECFIMGGKHVGSIGKIEEIIPGTATRRSEVKCRIGDETYTTLKNYIFPIKKQEW